MAPPPTGAPYAPRYPTLLALGFLVAWIALLCLPMLQGRFLVGPDSDQIWTGVPFRWFGAGEWRRTGEIPLWNPYMFGGLPFVGAMHGDIFYPTAWLRLVLPIDVAMNLGFAIHLVLAGFFAYLFFRALGVTWTGAVIGGTAYQLSGIVASLVHPGHDGKLFVSALMPLALLGLVTAIRRRRPEGYGVLALAVALCILSPQIQMTQYMLIFAGLFTLYLVFWGEDRPVGARRWLALASALGAVALGFGAAMIQLWPFIQYMPFAARSAGAQGWLYATSWAMPPANILDWLVPEFTGILGNYWGENAAKLHSEYLGAAVLALAAVGVGNGQRRRLLWWAGGVWLLFVLVSLAGHTPFYRIWYALVPGVKVTRAAGMAFYIPAFLVAMTAAFGAERLERATANRRVLYGSLAAAGLLLLVGASGALGGVARSLAEPGKLELARANGDAIAVGAVRSAAVLAVTAWLGLLAVAGKLSRMRLVLSLGLVAGLDLWYNDRRFFAYSPRAAALYADDDVTRGLAAVSKPYRVLDVGMYPTAFLMAKGIPNALGHHGNELHNYDQLLGGKNEWRFLGESTRLWDLLALRFVILPGPQQVPGYHLLLGPARTAPGHTAYLYEADSTPPYARVVPAAAKLPDEQIVPTLLDRRLDVNRVLLLSEDAPVSPPRLDSIPGPSAARAHVTAWEPGGMTIRLDPSPEREAYLLVSENYYPDWRAAIDGRPATVLRGDFTFLAVPVPRGAHEVTLRFERGAYRTGAYLSLASLVAVLGLIAVPLTSRRRRG